MLVDLRRRGSHKVEHLAAGRTDQEQIGYIEGIVADEVRSRTGRIFECREVVEVVKRVWSKLRVVGSELLEESSIVF
jgi:hypothetical protein